MVLVDALFIANEGGGPVLLRYLIDLIKSHPQKDKVQFLLDARFKYDIDGLNVIVVKGSILNRLSFYNKHRHKYSRFFCFTNIPPLRKCKGTVYTYFHNQLILKSRRNLINVRLFPFLLRYLFVRVFNANTDYYVVQTPHMVEDIVSLRLKKIDNVLILPFYKLRFTFASENKAYDHFAYVSSGSPHKNHKVLLDAWDILFTNGIFPTLHITVDDWADDVCNEIKHLQAKGLNIINHGFTNPASIYDRCSFCIYPSLNESFGLGIIEAASAGLKVIAADLPYVKSVVEPSESFDPLNAVSIAGSVERALKGNIKETKIKVADQANKLISLLLN